MTFKPADEKIAAAEKNRIYYDEIAHNYDAILDEETTNDEIRNAVKAKFTANVKTGRVLDFGGGTGRDLEWLIACGFEVFFCEPSKKMRQIAIDRHKSNPSVFFLHGQATDFTTWNNHSPFTKKVDAVLSDFAVINCVSNIELLFSNFAQVLRPGGSIIALMLQQGHKKSWKWKIKEKIKSLILHKPSVINVQYHDHQQIVFVYSLREIKKASAPFFELRSYQDMFEFTLFHFIKK